jgi:hypothetical protein
LGFTLIAELPEGGARLFVSMDKLRPMANIVGLSENKGEQN